MPNVPARARIDGKGMIRRRKVQNAVHHQRDGLDAGAKKTSPAASTRRRVRTLSPNNRTEGREASAPDPGQRQVLDVESVDLVQSAVMPAGVVAVVGRPRVRGWLQEQGRIEPLSEKGKW